MLMQAVKYEHWKMVPRSWGAWPWQYFTPREMADRRTGELVTVYRFLDALNLVRSFYARPLHLTSAYRSPYGNALAGGKPRSMHLFGLAADISIIDQDKHLIHRLAKDQGGFTGFGFYRTFLHIDMGRPRFWGKWDA